MRSVLRPLLRAIFGGSWLARGLALLALVGALDGCYLRRPRKTHGTQLHASEYPPAPPPDPVPVEEPVAVVPPPPPVAKPAAQPPAPAPPRRRPEPKDYRLGACGSGSGPRYGVHDVDEDDTLNIRADAGAENEVLGQLSPHATGVLSLGQRRRVGASTWHKVKCGSVVGWVNERFLSPSAAAR